MITAVIVLSVIALALGGFIALDILRGNRSVKGVTTPAEKPQTADNAAKPTAEQKREVEQPAPPAELTAAVENTPQAVADEPQAQSAAVDEQITEQVPKATDKPQAEKKPRRSRYKDPEIIFTEQVEKGRSKIEQKLEPQAEQKVEQKTEQNVEPQAKKKPNRPAAQKKPTKPTVEQKTEQKAELQTAEQQAAEPQSLAKEEKNKIAQNISGAPETVAETQRGDKAAEAKPAVESKVLPPDEVRAEVAATEVDKIMTDEVAVSFIEKSEVKTDKTKQGIINIDTLSACFDSGEVVTLDEIKKRVKGFNKKTTYVKVLARGTLGKALTVEADNFSLQAVKMIVLTGGKAIKKQ